MTFFASKDLESMDSISLDDPVDWPSDSTLGRKLDAFQQYLLCPICQGLFNNPQMLKCGHTFCSLCIRRHCDMTFNRTNNDICPHCREKADPFDLRKNVTVAALIEGYKNMKSDLEELFYTNKNKLSCQDVKPPSIEKRVASGKAITSRIAHFSFHGASKEKVKKAIEDVTKDSKVKLKVDGDKDVLERRLRELIHLINAQVGSENPLTLDEAVRRINEISSASERESKRDKFLSSKTTNKFEELTQQALASRKRKQAESSGPSPQNENVDMGTTIDVQEEFLWTNPLTLDEAVQHIDEISASQRERERERERESKREKISPNRTAKHAEQLEVGFLSHSEKAKIATDQGVQEAAKDFLWMSKVPSECFGPWRVIMDAQTKLPFYFNSSTEIGQFEIPDELSRLKELYHTSSSSGSSAAFVGAGTDVSNYVADIDIDIDAFENSLDGTIIEDIPASSSSQRKEELPLTCPPNEFSCPTEGNDIDQSQTRWSCSVCTYLHERLYSRCEMCDTANPSYFNITSKPKRNVIRSDPFSYKADVLLSSSANSSSKATQRKSK